MIPQFAREFKAHFVVTGSYLGRTLEKVSFLSAGDTDFLKMGPLTFSEFMGVFGERDLYENIDLFGRADHRDYDKLKGYFNKYLQVGAIRRPSWHMQ